MHSFQGSALFTDLHLEPLVDGGHPGEVLDAGCDVLLVLLLGEVQHVRGEQGLAVRLESGRGKSMNWISYQKWNRMSRPQ